MGNKKEYEGIIKDLEAKGFKKAVPISIVDHRTGELLTTKKQMDKYRRDMNRR